MVRLSSASTSGCVAKSFETVVSACAITSRTVRSFPPVLGLAATGLIAATLATTTAWLWAVGYMVLAVLVPVAYVAWLVHHGKLTDLHLPLREERIRPLLCTLIVAFAAWGCLRYAAAPRPLQWLAGVNSVQMVIFFAITLRWKISLHCAAAANLAVLAWALLGGAATPVILAVPLVAWARVHLQRHTLAQTAAGVCLGATLLLVALLTQEFA